MALAAVAALLVLSQCTSGEVARDAPTALPSLQFRLVRIEEATLGSLNAKGLRQPEDLNLADRSQVIREYVSGNLPLRMRLVLEARDPSLTARSINALDYEVALDEKPLGKGHILPNLALPADGSPIEFPLAFDLNTRKVLGDDAMPALRNFAVGLADRHRRPMRLAVRLRPATEGITAKNSTGFIPVMMDSVAQQL